MSSTNRGAVRNEADFYKTPEGSTKGFLDEFELRGKNFLECCAGDGAISKVLKDYYPDCDLMQVEIREEEKDGLEKYGKVEIDDFRYWYPGGEIEIPCSSKIDTIISNPPFSTAFADYDLKTGNVKDDGIIEHCFEIANDDTEIIMLLRLNVLGSQKRKWFWDKHPVTQIYVLRQRPSFTGHGTDSIEYAWFVWSNRREPGIFWID